MSEPRTWVDSEVVTAEMMNTEIRDQFNGVFDLISGIFAGRKGGDALVWNTQGTNNYPTTSVKVQFGSILCPQNSNTTVIFPVAFASGQEPLVFMTPVNTINGRFASIYIAHVSNVDVWFSNTDFSQSCQVNWLAIGPA